MLGSGCWVSEVLFLSSLIPFETLFPSIPFIHFTYFVSFISPHDFITLPHPHRSTLPTPPPQIYLNISARV